MPDRIITQRAQGYGDQPAMVTVQIDGTTILQGEIPTLDQPPPTLPDDWSPELGVNAWSWTVDAAFSGTQTMTVTVNNGAVDLYDTYQQRSDRVGNVWLLKYPQGNIGNIQLDDPFTSVTINGVSQAPVRQENSAGQWVWSLTAGDEFVGTVNIVPPTAP